MSASETHEGRVDRPWLENEEIGLRIDLARMPGAGEPPAGEHEPIGRALEEMRALEAGAIANPDEQRRVGHYWLRAPDLAPDAETSLAIRAAVEQVKAFAAGARAGRVQAPAGPFRRFLLIGIGGSALGPQLLADALAPMPAPLQPHFLDNTDPEGIARVLSEIGDELDRTLLIVVSKSGGTKETRNGLLEVAAALASRGLAPGPQAVAVTMAGSDLDRQARREGFLASFPLWDWVGGRTSITSAVGLLPAALLGIGIDEFLAGARSMDAWTRAGVPAQNPAARLALAWHAAGGGRGERDMVVLPYRDRLALFGRYLQQLVMESLGKELDRARRVVHQGLTVYGNKGSTDQHAFVQQLREGPDRFFVTFLQVLADGGPGEPGAAGAAASRALFVEPEVTSSDYLLGFLLGTRAALAEKGRASLLITLEALTPRTLGALVALFERAVGLYASLIGVNAYHQPGVEAGKKAAGEVLALQRSLLALLRAESRRAFTAEEAARAAGGADPELAGHVLRHLAANGRVALEREAGSREARYRALCA